MEKLREVLTKMAGAVGPDASSTVGKLAGVGVVGTTALAYGGSSCLYNVEGGHRAVMFHRFGGVQQSVKGEGTHLLVPWFMKQVVEQITIAARKSKYIDQQSGVSARFSIANYETMVASARRLNPEASPRTEKSDSPASPTEPGARASTTIRSAV